MRVLDELLELIILWATVFEVSTSGRGGCHCPGGCSVPPTPCSLPCERGWSGPFCHRENIALGKATEQTGSFNDTNYCPPPDPHFGPLVCGVKGPGLAVDGDTDHTYWHGSCSHTVPHNFPARWSVDLVDSHLVSHLDIHLDEDQETFNNAFTVTVDGQWCQNWTQSGHSGLVADIMCSHPLHGSNLTILSFPGKENKNLPMLDLCEVEVYECNDFWFGVDCDKQCHCRNKTEVCDKFTGQCASGCAVARFGNDCQLVDIAYKKPAFQSSPDGHDVSGVQVTVDGDPGSCQTSVLRRPLTFWSVDLAKTADINSIRIHSQNNLADGLEANVTVDGKLCYELSSPRVPTRVVDINCTGYLAGSNVSIVITSSGHSLDLCEVEVYECADYTYGATCDERCNCRDVTEVCNKVTGHCDSGCPAGKTGVSCQQSCSDGQYGPDCSSHCGHCAPGSVCDHVTGHCEDSLCSGLWEGPRCDECRNGTFPVNGTCKPCSTCVNDTCNTRNGRCNFGCKPGYSTPMCDQNCPFDSFGKDCSSECGSCSNINETCHHITGRCASGCAQNFTGTYCKECVTGVYGSYCDKQCGECQGGTACYRKSGSCKSGCLHNTQPPLCQMCPRGKYGTDCGKRCGHCKYGENCDRHSGVCTKGCSHGWTGDMCTTCRDSFYGDTCSPCGYCANNRTCDSTSGTCPEGCISGWTGQRCNLDCPRGFYGYNCSLTCGHCKGDDICDSRTGQCPAMTCREGYMGSTCKIVCRAGTFGTNCRFRCGHCRHNVSCEIINGSCPHDRCISGYMNPRCQKECPEDRYGAGCVHYCHNCKTGCNSETGVCLEGACVTGWSGEMCMEDTSSSKPGVVAAAVIVPLIIIGIGAAIFFWWWRRRRRQKADREGTDLQRGGRLPYLGRDRRSDIQMGEGFPHREREGMINGGFRDRSSDMPRRDGREREGLEVIEEYVMPRGSSDTNTEGMMNDVSREDQSADMPRRGRYDRNKEWRGGEDNDLPRSGRLDRDKEERKREENDMPRSGRHDRDKEERKREENDMPRSGRLDRDKEERKREGNDMPRSGRHDRGQERREREHTDMPRRERLDRDQEERNRDGNEMPRRGRQNRGTDEREKEDNEMPRSGVHSRGNIERDREDNDMSRRGKLNEGYRHDRYSDNQAYRDNGHSDIRNKGRMNEAFRDNGYANMPRRGRYDRKDDTGEDFGIPNRSPDKYKEQRLYENFGRSTDRQNPRTNKPVNDRRHLRPSNIQEHPGHRDRGLDIQVGRTERDMRRENIHVDIQHESSSVDI